MDNIFLLLLFIFLIFQRPQKDPFERENTDALKGICALAIVFRHLLASGQDPLSERLFGNGFLFVAVFFLLSGYGYSLSLQKNRNLNCLWKRLMKILVPFCTVAVVQTVVYAVTDYDVDFQNIVPGTYIPYSWYVYAILLFYAAYYGVSINKKRELRVLIFGLLLAVYIVLCAFVLDNVGISWYMSVGALWAGVVLGEFPELKRALLKYQNPAIFVCAAGFAVCIRFYDWQNISSCVFQNITVIFFALLIMLLSAKVNIVNRAVKFGGEVSYELYLIQGLVQQIVNQYVTVENRTILTGIIVFLDIAGACYINKLNVKILQRLLKKQV